MISKAKNLENMLKGYTSLDKFSNIISFNIKNSNKIKDNKLCYK